MQHGGKREDKDMETKVIYRRPLGNADRKYRQDNLVISTFKGSTDNIRLGIENCKEMNFNLLEFGWTTPEDCKKCMVACEEVGIDGIFQDWDTFGGFQDKRGLKEIDADALQTYLEYTHKFRHVKGYYVWDEPGKEETMYLAAKHLDIMEKADPDKLPYIVAYPSYNKKWEWGNGEFFGYLTRYAEIINPPVLSLDYYPFDRKNPYRPHQLDDSELFLDIALLRKIALEKDIPMWFYFQTQDDPWRFEYREFTAEQIRVQQYNALLHGAKGLQNYNVAEGALNKDGTKGPLFEATKDINKRCYQMGKTLMALTSVGVYHSKEVLEGNKDFEAYRESVCESKVLANEELPFRCSVGEFKDCEENRYLFIQNRDYEKARTFKLKLQKKFRVYEVSQEHGMQSVRNYSVTGITLRLEPGDAKLLRFQDVKENAYLIDYVLEK